MIFLNEILALGLCEAFGGRLASLAYTTPASRGIVRKKLEKKFPKKNVLLKKKILSRK